MTAMFSVFLLCAIELAGVTGSDLRARAFFDANNVKVRFSLSSVYYVYNKEAAKKEKETKKDKNGKK